jgi:y4mF family transcriptional regulator
MRARRKALNLTQVEASELAGVGVTTIIDIERGKASVRLDRLVAVLSSLGLVLTLGTGRGGLRAGEDE